VGKRIAAPSQESLPALGFLIRISGIRGETADLVDPIAGILTSKANISIVYYLLCITYRLSTDSKTRDLEWPFCAGTDQ